MPRFLKTSIISVCAAGLLILVGCTSKGVRVPKIPPKPYEPQNVYALDHIPTSMIRVAVLPAYHPEEEPSILERFDKALVTELSKVQLFELVPIERSYLRRHFGEDQINSASALPASLMAKIFKDYQAQGVLFTDVTDYHPYRPIRVGLRAKLVDLRDGELVWVFDDVFDSAQPNVSAASRRYARQVYTDRFPLDSADSMLQSPYRFSRYAIHEAFETMPTR